LTQIKWGCLNLISWATTRVFDNGAKQMASSLPLIRAASIAPMRRWLKDIGQDPYELLTWCDLDWVPEDMPFLPIPLRNAVCLLGEIAHRNGPDAPYWIVGKYGALKIGLIGASAISGVTVRNGLDQIARDMRHHSTHEFFRVENTDCGVQISDAWTVKHEPEEYLHAVQQYVVALVNSICRLATKRPQNLTRVRMVPHPEYGLSHLAPWLGDRVEPAHHRSLEITIDSNTIMHDFPEWAKASAVHVPSSNWSELTRGNTLVSGIEVLIESMLPRKPVSLEFIANAAGISPRTLKRRLKSHGTSFSEVLDETRARIAIRRLEVDSPPSRRTLSRELGYANQETLTRAMDRWAEKPVGRSG
jgi:AraC-like DNA-binding protein